MSGEPGGRIFFSNVRRSLEIEDEILLASVGVDIGSSTSHLVFSHLVLERLDNRYVVSERKVVHESEVLLTPYAGDATIDAQALGRFIDRQYELAGVDPETIDTGALILTGVAVRRSNARAIGELFASQAGKFVSVSAGDSPPRSASSSKWAGNPTRSACTRWSSAWPTVCSRPSASTLPTPALRPCCGSTRCATGARRTWSAFRAAFRSISTAAKTGPSAISARRSPERSLRGSKLGDRESSLPTKGSAPP